MTARPDKTPIKSLRDAYKVSGFRVRADVYKRQAEKVWQEAAQARGKANAGSGRLNVTLPIVGPIRKTRELKTVPGSGYLRRAVFAGCQ